MEKALCFENRMEMCTKQRDWIYTYLQRKNVCVKTIDKLSRVWYFLNQSYANVLQKRCVTILGGKDYEKRVGVGTFSDFGY